MLFKKIKKNSTQTVDQFVVSGELQASKTLKTKCIFINYQ